MKKVTALLVVFLFLMFSISSASEFPTQSTIIEKISSVKKAKEIARMAKGGYWEGSVAPPLRENEVALPVIDKSGKIIGHIVADRTKLISALNAEGLTNIASALAAAQAGTAAGLAVRAGISAGTIGLVALGAGVVVGIALAISGAGKGVTTTTHH
jgi:hypothetical protein